MNIGIYIDSLTDSRHIESIANFVNATIDKNKIIKDMSIFYDDVGYVPFDIKCGIFNSVDMWNFSGHLITTSISTMNKAINIVNNIDLYYYFGWEKTYKVMDLLMILDHNPKIICRDENNAKDFYRVTGINPIGITNDYSDIVNIIKENSNEYAASYKNVCRTE